MYTLRSLYVELNPLSRSSCFLSVDLKNIEYWRIGVCGGNDKESETKEKLKSKSEPWNAINLTTSKINERVNMNSFIKTIMPLCLIQPFAPVYFDQKLFQFVQRSRELCVEISTDQILTKFDEYNCYEQFTNEINDIVRVKQLDTLSHIIDNIVSNFQVVRTIFVDPFVVYATENEKRNRYLVSTKPTDGVEYNEKIETSKGNFVYAQSSTLPHRPITFKKIQKHKKDVSWKIQQLRNSSSEEEPELNDLRFNDWEEVDRYCKKLKEDLDKQIKDLIGKNFDSSDIKYPKGYVINVLSKTGYFLIHQSNRLSIDLDENRIIKRAYIG